MFVHTLLSALQLWSAYGTTHTSVYEIFQFQNKLEASDGPLNQFDFKASKTHIQKPTGDIVMTLPVFVYSQEFDTPALEWLFAAVSKLRLPALTCWCFPGDSHFPAPECLRPHRLRERHNQV